MENKELFDVVVIATMSAGKSTVINALIGQELLHSANEATTATITRIQDVDNLPYFSGNAYSYDNILLEESNQIDAETLKKWNANPKIKMIDLIGDVQALQNDKMDIVLYDTPGPNNSQDDNHEALTMEVIDNGHYGLILYVLNATQLGVNDDHSLLSKIYESLSKNNDKEIIFLLNKADSLDPEKGETLYKLMTNTQAYLENIGFKNPIIIQTAANYSLYAEKALNGEKLTRPQRNELKSAFISANKSLLISARVPLQIKTKVLAELKDKYSRKRIEIVPSYYATRQGLKRLVIRSGFGLVRYILQQRLAKKSIY